MRARFAIDSRNFCAIRARFRAKCKEEKTPIKPKRQHPKANLPSLPHIFRAALRPL